MTAIEDLIVGAAASAALVDANDEHPAVAGIRDFSNNVLPRGYTRRHDDERVAERQFSSGRRRPEAQDDAWRHQRRS